MFKSGTQSGSCNDLDRRPSGLVRSGGPRRAGLRVEAIFDDLAVKGAATDVEDACRFLLVPAHGFEHPRDMGSFGVGQRRDAWWWAHLRFGVRVQELDVAVADDPSGRGECRTRDGAF